MLSFQRKKKLREKRNESKLTTTSSSLLARIRRLWFGVRLRQSNKYANKNIWVAVNSVSKLSNEFKEKKVICEECEFSQYDLNENELDKIKMVKMKHCLASKKRQIAKENDKREKRDVESKDDASFQDLFKTSSSFKKLLNELLDMKEEVTQRANKFEKDMQKAVNELIGDEKTVKKTNNWWKMEKKMKTNQPAECDQKLRCEANQVIKIKQAVLTSQDQENTCASVNKYLPIQIDSLSDECYNKEEATKRLTDL